MARIRTIKPEFFRHSGLYDAEKESGIPLRVAYAALFTVADREGRFRWRPRELKLDCLPHDDVDFSRVLDALATRGFIVKYTSEDEHFGYIPTFKEHQVINNRERDSSLPNPLDCNEYLARTPRVPHAYPTPLVRAQAEKEKEKEKEGRYIPPIIPPELPDWLPKQVWADFCEHRKNMKKKLTPKASKLIIAKLEKWRHRHDIEGIINTSIERGWAGIFEPKPEPIAGINQRQSGQRMAGSGGGGRETWADAAERVKAELAAERAERERAAEVEAGQPAGGPLVDGCA